MSTLCHQRNTLNRKRKPYGEGWALVGDAGYCRDPTTAWGISDAFRDAENLSVCIDDCLSGKSSESSSLAKYEWQRNQSVKDIYAFFTHYIAPLKGLAPELTVLASSIVGKQDHIDNFMGAVAGTTSMKKFYSVGNLYKIMGISGFANIGYQKARNFMCMK